MSLILLVVLSLLAVVVIYRRQTDELVRSSADNKAVARRAADSGLHAAMAHAMADRQSYSADGQPFYIDADHTGWSRPELFEEAAIDEGDALGNAGRFTLVRRELDPNIDPGGLTFGYDDEAARLNINTASREQWQQLLTDAGVANVSDVIAAIEQWRGRRLAAAEEAVSATSATNGATTGTGGATSPPGRAAGSSPRGGGSSPATPSTAPPSTATPSSATAAAAAAGLPAGTDPAALAAALSEATGGSAATDSSSSSPFGSESASVPFRTKSGNFETVEELLRVTLPDGTPAIPRSVLFGADRNRNGLIEPSEQVTGSAGLYANTGLAPLLTVWSVDYSAAQPDGSRLINLNRDLSSSTATGTSASASSGSSGDTSATDPAQQLNDELVAAGLDVNLVGSLIGYRKNGGQFYSVGDLLLLGVAQDQLSDLLDKVTVLEANPGAININTAPEPMLVLLLMRVKKYADDPTAAATTAAQIAERRATLGAEGRNIAWLLDVLPAEEFRIIARYATTRSFQFRVDSSGTSDDGRTFHRIEAVFDITRSRPAVLYYRDISGLGPPMRFNNFRAE